MGSEMCIRDSTHVDEWTTRVTDADWLEDVRRRLVLCQTPAEVRGLYAEAGAVQQEGRLSSEDAQSLKDEMAARTAELRGDA